MPENVTKHPAGAAAQPPYPPSNDNDGQDGPYAALLGSAAWHSLPPTVKARFFGLRPANAVTVYRGYVASTHYSRIGQALAQCLRLIGGPLPTATTKTDTLAAVIVSDDPSGKAQYWTRRYGRPGHFPHVIQSAKQFSGPTGLEENIGFGIGMTLNISAKDGALQFTSDRYFVKVFGRRVFLPRALCPGLMQVSHTDFGEGWFEFRLTLSHPLVGRLLDQRAMFCDEGTL